MRLVHKHRNGGIFGLAFTGDLLAGLPVDFPDDSGPLPFICG